MNSNTTDDSNPKSPEEMMAMPDALRFMSYLWAVNHAMERLSKSMRTRLGITAQQRMVIRLIGSSPGISPGELARMLHVDPGTLSAGLRRLEARKLVQRIDDVEDRRRVMLRLTEDGAAYDRPQEGTIEAAAEGTLAHLTEGQREALSSCIQRFIAECEKRCNEASGKLSAERS